MRRHRLRPTYSYRLARTDERTYGDSGKPPSLNSLAHPQGLVENRIS